MNKLPNGWIWAKFEDISILTAGNSAPQETKFFEQGKFSFVRVADMGNMRYDIYIKETRDKINELAAKNLKLFPKGSVLFTKSGMSILLNQRAILNHDMYVVSHIGVAMPLGNIPSEFLYYWLKTVDFKELTHATTLPSLQLSKVRSLEIPLPPLNEQKRLVAKIDELFKENKLVREALDKIPQIMKKFRQSVLEMAFRGELVKQNPNDKSVIKVLERIKEERNRFKIKTKEKFSKYDEPKPINVNQKLPIGWNWVYLGALLQDARYGSSVKCDSKVKGIPVIRIPNILLRSLDFSNLKYANFDDDELQRLKLEEGDVLVCRTNGSIDLVGKSAVVKKLDKPFAFASYLIRLRPIKFAIVSSYLNLILESRLGRDIIEERARTTAGQYNVNLATLASIKIPLPPLDEQKKIIEKIEESFSFADQIEKSVEEAKRRADRIDQAILAKAFRGELVPQNPRDEPASVLLERIRKEVEVKPVKKIKKRVKIKN